MFRLMTSPLRHNAFQLHGVSFRTPVYLTVCLLALLLPAISQASVGFLTDTLGSFTTDNTRFDTCGSCHASWTAPSAGSLGDFALDYKLWDYDTGTAGLSAALSKIDTFGTGRSNDWRIANQTSDAPFPFTGAADKDGDGYIDLLYRTELTGLPFNPSDICSDCVSPTVGGATGQLPTHPLGWDLDDNDATINGATGLPMGAVPWSWTTVLAQPGATAQDKLSTYFSSDTIAPAEITDLHLDTVGVVGIGHTDPDTGLVTIPPNALPVTWTAPADDDPANPSAVDVTVPVHNYDLRYTTELVLNNYNTNFPSVRCSATAGVIGSLACDIRNPDHWYTLTNIADCGIGTGSGQTHLTPTGVVAGASSNACASGVLGWDRGEATPLMRGLYVSGFEDETSGLGSGNYVTGPPYAPASPGSSETYVLEEVTAKHLYVTSGQFQYTDIHDGATATEPNYIAPDTVYWLTMLSNDGTVQPCVESTGDERSSASGFCQPDVGDGTIYGGPFTESDGLGIGFNSYAEPGFQGRGNIIAMKSGSDTPGVRSGIGISAISPVSLDAYASPAVVTIDGIGFQENVDPTEVTNGAKVVLTSVATGATIESDGTVTLDGTTPDRKMTVSFPIAGLLGDYTLEIRDRSGRTVAAWVNAINIIDTNPGTIRLASSGSFSVNEDAGPGNIVVERIGGSYGAVTVQVDTSDGTATIADNDYTAVTGTVVTWADGESGQKTVPVTITADSTVEPDETVAVTLSNATGTTLDNLQPTESGTLTIVNDDTSFEFNAAAVNVVENAGTAIITVNRIGSINGAVSVDYATSDGTATIAGNDYTAASGTLSWADQDGAAKTFAVTINNDAAQEANETVTLTLSNPSGGAISGTNPATLTIIDDDTPDTLQFDVSSYVVDESAGTATLNVVRSGNLLGTVSVSFSTSDGGAVTAEADNTNGLRDYEPLASGTQTLSWGDGVGGTQTLSVTINEDTVDELDSEDFTVTLDPASVTGSTVNPVIGTTNAASVSLTDNDSVLAFGSPTYSVNENGVSVTVDVTRTDLSNTFTGPVSLDVASSDGTAVTTEVDNTNGLRDYEPVSTTLSWADGDNTPQTFTVTINDDLIQEANETVTLTLSNSTGNAGISGTNPATLTIIDDDSSDTLQFDASSYVVNESDGTATLNVVRSGNLIGAVSVSFSTSDGGAVTTEADNTNGLRDFEPVASGAQTLTWGDGIGGVQTLSITVNEDTVDELDSEDFTVTLDPASVTGNAAIGTTNATIVSLTDNDSVLAFGSPTYSVNENGVSVTLDVTRTDLSNTFPGALSLQYDTVDGTAVSTGADNTNGLRDFEPVVAGSLNWADGDTVNTTQTITLTINDDTIVEGPESFSVNLSNATGDSVGQAAIGAQASTTVDITDDEQPGQVRFVSATFSHSEDAGGTAATSTATISVERVGGSAGIASVTYATADNTAVSTAPDNSAGLRDYEPATNTLTWADGVSGIQTFTVTVNNDAIVESPDEFLDLALSNPQVNGGAYPTLITGTGAQATATLTITDSVGTLQFSGATYTVSETGGLATITVTRVGGSNGAVAVDYASADNTATSPADYTAVTGTLNWAAGDAANKTFTISVVNDGIIEVGGEIVDLSLSNVQGAQLGTQSTATLTILDSVGTLQFDGPTYSVNEDGGIDATITVTRNGGSSGAVSVDYATADGAVTPATAGVDYTAAGGTLNWADGDVASKTFTVTITPDLLIEAGGETVDLSLSNPVGAALGSQATATLTIIDSVGRVVYVSAPYSVIEDTAGSVTITAQRIEGSGGQFDVPYASSDGTATIADNDYTAASGTLSWLDGETGNKTFTVAVTSDRNIEADETVTLTLSPPAQSAVATTLTIVNDDAAGTLQIDSATYNVNETLGGTTVTLNVSRSGGDVGAVSVDFSTADGTAVSTDPDNSNGLRDYEPVLVASPGTLNWADADSAVKTIVITINDDLLFEGGEAFSVNLSNAAGGASLGTTTSSTVNIIDNDSAGTVQFSAPTYTVNEDGGVDAVITVTRTGGTDGQIDVDYATADGAVNPATAVTDYTAQSGTLTWLAGDATDRTITIPVVNDALAEDPDETVDLTLSNPLYGGAPEPLVLGAQTTATLTIIDSYGQLQFSAPTYQVREGGGVDAVISVSRSGGSNQALSVDYATADNTATAGLDYTAASGTLNWADGDGADKTFTVAVVDDGIVESPDELVSLALTNTQVNAAPVAYVLGTQNTADLTIIDGAGRLQFAVAGYSIAEDGSGSVVLSVTRSGGSNGDVTVDYATTDGTALAGSDYTATSGTLTWLSGDTTSQTITVPITNDAIVEPSETFTVDLTNPTLNSAADVTVLGTQTSSTVTIIDSVGSVQFDSATYSVNEDGGIDATITVTRSGGTNGAVSVDYATADGAVNPATAGVDYTAASGTLNWASGDGTSKTFTVPVINDAIDEADETVDLTLSNFVGASAGGQTTATLTIIDSFGTLQFDSPTYSVNEDGGIDATITVTRVGGTNGAISVDYTTADNVSGLAVAGTDYTASSGTLNWADADSASKTFTVPVINDAIDEDPDEYLDLNLSNPLGGAQLGAQSSATLTIIDSFGNLEFSSPTFAVNEDGGVDATISVSRVGGSNGAAAINYASLDGDVATTATAGVDYTSVSGTLNWADADATSKTFSVPVVNDTIIEKPDEQVLFEISGATGAALGTQTQATLTIIDGAGALQFDSATYSVNENGGSIVLSVSRSGGITGAVSVDYATADASATAGSDYTLTSGTLNWADGDGTAKTITVPILDDSVVEGDETFGVTLSNAVGIALGAQTSSTVTIIENDVAGNLEFTAAGFSVNEDGVGVATISVRRSLGSVGAISVDYATSDGTAVAGSDYTSTSGTLNWADGDALDKTFTIPITPDSIIELGGETVNIALSNPTNFATIDQGATMQPATTLQIIDSAGSLQFTASSYSALEPSGTAILNVARVGGSGGAVSVDYASSDGSAVAGSDYVTATGSLNWADGDINSKPLMLSLINDNLIESDETINVSLLNPQGGAAVGAPASAVLTIISEDGPGTIQLSSASYGVFENAGVATITISRVSGKIGAVSVDVQTTPDSGGANPATVGADYTAVPVTTITWPDGDSADKTIDIAITDDAVFEANETFKVTLSNPINVTINTPSSAVVTIGNDDGATGTSATVNPGWSMISVPTDLAVENRVTNIFGDDLSGQQTAPVVYRRVSAGVPGSFSGAYVIADVLEPGQGYFIINELTSPATLDDQYNGLQTTDPYELTMPVGGGMLGNPYSTTKDLLVDARVCNFTQSASVPQCSQASDWVDWATAAANGWVTGSIYGYDTDTSSYQVKNPVDGTMLLNPWESYWFRTEVSDELHLRIYDQVAAP